MKITNNHIASKNGVPVCIDNSGEIIPPRHMVKAIRTRLGLSVLDLALLIDRSPRTVQGWEQGRSVPPEILNRLGELLEPVQTNEPKPRWKWLERCIIAIIAGLAIGLAYIATYEGLKHLLK